MSPIIRWTLRTRRWSIWWWCVGIAAFVALELSVYPSIKSQAKQLNQLLDRLPDTVKSLFGANDLFSPTGYLNSRLFYLLLPLFLSILAIGLGSSLLAREENNGTIELLLGRPVSRGRLMMAKLIGGLLVIIAVTLVSTAAIMVGVKVVHLTMPLQRIAFATMMAALISTLFGTVAFAITAVGRVRGAAIGIACLFGLGGYIMASLETTVSWLKWPARLFPYHYYNPASVLDGRYDWLTVSWLTAGILILGVLSWMAFQRRDIGN